MPAANWADLSPSDAVFLVFALLFLPWAALRSRRRVLALRKATDGAGATGAGDSTEGPGATGLPDASRIAGAADPAQAAPPRGVKPGKVTTLPGRRRVLASTLIMLAVLTFTAHQVAAGRDWNLFWAPDLDARAIGIGFAALVLLLAVRTAVARGRSEEERRKLNVYLWMPRDAGDWAFFAATALAAGIAEEAAYRGAAIWILEPLIGNLWVPILASATAFTIAHSIQGAKSMALVFAFSLAMHAVVELTDTLVVAMAVHATYDLIVGGIASRELARWDREGTTSNRPGAA